MKKLVLLFVFLLPVIIRSQNSERNLSSEYWQFRKQGDSNWFEAKVPGTVHTDLFQNYLIPDPFFGNNEKQLQWIENEDWHYQTTFIISEKEIQHENAVLQFDGLDTYAEVFLNGNKILSADNMFRTWKVDVKKQLKIGQNQLKITFESAVKKGKEIASKLSYTLPGDEKVFTRKAQYHYGWDWGPRFVTAGIWKKVSLQYWDKATITTIKCNQKTLTDALAQLEFILSVKSSKAGKFQIQINDRISDIQLQKGKNEVLLSYAIPNPKRWWPNGLGDAYLYPIKVQLKALGQKIDEEHLSIGLRTIELVQEKDKVGKSFYFKVNGEPVFIKGSNYIPPDSFLPRATDSVYKSIVKNAKSANMNMLRVWGGGVYADDAFYAECDKNGILVWQDFMFACAMYPGNDDYIESVKHEVIDNVNRLQNHPSIALWCGNNEMDEGWRNWGWQKQYNYSVQDSTTIWNDYKKLFHQVIPKTLDSLLSKDKNRYWPSSPSIGWGRKESLLQGDSHYWGVWWGKEPFEVYEKKVGRFMSEYGFQGMPNLETIKTFTGNDDLSLHSEPLRNHQKHPTGYQTINEYMVRDYKVPTRFEDYIYVSQLLQAAGMKTAIEAHRRAKPYCMGTLFWQMNDCWPVTSWSSVDYYGRWKAMQYQVKKSFENKLISVEDNDENYKIYLVNDSSEKPYGRFTLQLIDFKGKILWECAKAILVSDSSNDISFEIPKSQFNAFDTKESVLFIRYKSEKESIDTLYYFVKPKDLQLTKPTIEIHKIDDLTYEVSSDVLTKNVNLNSQQETFFSDNYFDILPNQKIQVKLSKPIQKLEVKSLFDTLK